MEQAELRDIVSSYLEHCRTGDERFSDAAMAVTAISFISPPEQQWQMVLEAVRQARDDNDLGHVAAGPIEGLLGRYGEQYIEPVDQRAAADPKFARAMTGVWKYRMSDEVWSRVQALQARCTDPLHPSEGCSD